MICRPFWASIRCFCAISFGILALFHSVFLRYFIRYSCVILVSVFASQDIRCPDWCVCEQCRRGWWETGRTSWRLIFPMTNLPLAWCAGKCRQPTCIHPHLGLGIPRSTGGNIARQEREADTSYCGQSVRLFPIGQTNIARPWIWHRSPGHTLSHCRLHARNSEFSFYFSYTLEWEICIARENATDILRCHTKFVGDVWTTETICLHVSPDRAT